MSVNRPNNSILQDLVDLLKEKQELETRLGQIDAKISSVVAGKKLSGGKARRGPKPKAERPAKPAGKKGGARGKLKESILALLQKAGSKGVSAREVSQKLGVPNQHVHVWFGTTGKKVPGLTKPAKGVWVLKSK